MMEPFQRRFYSNLSSKEKLLVDCALLLDLRTEFVSQSNSGPAIDAAEIETMRNNMAEGFGSPVSIIKAYIGNNDGDQIKLIAETLAAIKQIGESNDRASKQCAKILPLLTELADLQLEMTPTQKWLEKITQTAGTQQMIKIER